MGALQYAAQGTRLDLTSSIGDAAKHMKKHGKVHWDAVKCVIQYANLTATQGLVFGRDKKVELVVYVDADFASDRKNRQSTMGYVIMLGGGMISWKSKQQDYVTTSTTEAEYVALSLVAREICWLRNLLGELGFEQTKLMKVFEDNQGVIYLVKNETYKGKSRHIDVAYHFGQEKQRDGTIEVEYYPTKEQVMDMLTKGIPSDVLDSHKQVVGVVESPQSLERVGVSDAKALSEDGVLRMREMVMDRIGR